jgi:hypothetical protein
MNRGAHQNGSKPTPGEERHRDKLISFWGATKDLARTAGIGCLPRIIGIVGGVFVIAFLIDYPQWTYWAILASVSAGLVYLIATNRLMQVVTISVVILLKLWSLAAMCLVLAAAALVAWALLMSDSRLPDTAKYNEACESVYSGFFQQLSCAWTLKHQDMKAADERDELERQERLNDARRRLHR